MKELDIELNGFMKDHDFKLINYDNNECVLEAPINEKTLNPYDMAHGGLIFGLMDTCGGMHVILETGRKVVTISSSINFIKPGMGNKLIAKSKAIKIGKNLCVIEVNTYNDIDNLVATGVFNFYYIN